MTTTGYWLRRAGALLLLLGAFPAHAQAPVALDAFFQNRTFTNARISPTGRHVAVTVTAKTGRTQLVVLETGTLQGKAVASPQDADIGFFDWVNDERLVFSVADRGTGQGDTYEGPGLYAVQRDGSEFRQLIDRQQPWVRERGDRAARVLDFFHEFHATTAKKDSDDVFVVRNELDNRNQLQGLRMFRVNTRTGEASAVRGPGQAMGWLVDEKDVPRVTTTVDGARGAVRWLDPADNEWKPLVDFDRYLGREFIPVGFTPGGDLMVSARTGASDKRALYRYDPKKRALDAEPLLALKDFDFDGRLVTDAQQLLGVHYLSDSRGTAWFDARMKDVQARLDKALPATVNQLQVPVRAQAPFVLVRAYSDVDPGRFLLFDTDKGRLVEIGAALPGIEPRRMAAMDLVRFAARDGLQVPAWLTLPKDAKGRKVPLVVLVHGGPWVREEWQWRPEVQFLASRGYAVLEPEFRGSAGFGFQHFAKGLKQWGLAMQDDVADAAKWAVAQGIADPQRICIAGASYGGYATLMGLVRNPELFKCGVAWAGVADILMMYDVVWSDFSPEYKSYGMPRLVGDREKDAAQLKATSPIEQAARIAQPLLLAHGGADRRVPIVHSTRLRDALAKTNPKVEWVEYTEEGHGWYLVKNRVDFWARVEKFLQNNLRD